MELAIPDTAITPIDLQKIRSGDPAEFQKLYRKFYDALVNETTLLLNDHKRSVALVQLAGIQSWVHCEAIASEQYYFGYARSRVLRYAQPVSDDHRRINHELAVLNELLAVQYERPLYYPDNLYEKLTGYQKTLIRKTFTAYNQPLAPAAHSQTLLNYAFYTLHYILL